MSLSIRIRHIPMNFFTTKTIFNLASEVGHVEEIAYDTKVSHTKDYILALNVFNTDNSMNASQKLDIGGEGVNIEFEYEKIHKRCFHCLRLTHEKLKCPLWKKLLNRGSLKIGDTGPALLPRPNIENKIPHFLGNYNSKYYCHRFIEYFFFYNKSYSTRSLPDQKIKPEV